MEQKCNPILLICELWQSNVEFRFPPTHNTDNPEVSFEETSPDYSLVE